MFMRSIPPLIKGISKSAFVIIYRYIVIYSKPGNNAVPGGTGQNLRRAAALA
jgi:hypothetical protein